MSSAETNSWAIETASLTKTYQMGDSEVHALRSVDMKVKTGEFLALMGTSGCGKSTLMHLLGCLDTPTSGKYLLEGRDVGSLSASERAEVRNGRIGFVFQTFNLLPRLSALENVMLPLLYRGRAPRAREQAIAALTRVGLADRADHRPTEMSGGQQQRVAIARALVGEPALILADEPTGNLDSRTGADIMELIISLWRDGRTVVMVTHDADVAARAGRTMHMHDGRIEEEGSGIRDQGSGIRDGDQGSGIGDQGSGIRD
jgi:putative ABC transport system ATP-binding protein